jgi:hypothetical protein
MRPVDHPSSEIGQVTLTPEQTVYEGPEDIHVVERNASNITLAKTLVGVLSLGRSGSIAPPLISEQKVEIPAVR